MKKIMNAYMIDEITEDLKSVENTNRLFLELIYDLEHYPQHKKAQDLVYRALLIFEEERFLQRVKKVTK